MTNPSGPLVGSKADDRSLSSSLIDRARLRDEEAWHRIIFLYEPIVRGWCRQLRVPNSDLSDVVQEVLRALVSGLAEFRRDRPGDTFRGWLYSIARHKVQDFWRRSVDSPAAVGGTAAVLRLAEVPADLDTLESSSADPSEITGLLTRALKLIESEFAAKTWQAFWQTTIDESSAAETGVRLGMSVGAVYVAKSRVLRRLREELSGLENVDLL